jgi:hypothetical protein
VVQEGHQPGVLLQLPDPGRLLAIQLTNIHGIEVIPPPPTLPNRAIRVVNQLDRYAAGQG